MSDLAYAGDIVALSNSYRDARPARSRQMTTLIFGEQRQSVLFDGEPRVNVDIFKCLVSMFFVSGQATKRSEAGLILPLRTLLSAILYLVAV